jgi:hypothetical protein
MTIDEAEDALRTIQGFSRIGIEDAVVEMRGFASYSNGMIVSVDTGAGGLVAAIEVQRPLVPSPDVLDDFDVFAVPADELIRHYSSVGEVESEERGRTIILPDRLVTFGRRDIPRPENNNSGYYFDSVLVARPGYY